MDTDWLKEVWRHTRKQSPVAQGFTCFFIATDFFVGFRVNTHGPVGCRALALKSLI
jgi:hypothetical protein